MKKETLKKLKDFAKKINKQYGEDTIQLGMVNPKKIISTGLSYLDSKIGGIPMGSFIQLYGRPKGGKSTLAWQIAASFQKQGYSVGYIDAERGLTNNVWPETLGVNMDEVLYTKPKNAEDSLIWIEKFSKLGVDLVILDSIIALATEAEININKNPLKEADKKVKGLDNKEPALLARKLGKWLSTAIPTIDDNKTAVLFINQVRNNLGSFTHAFETYSGGNALKHDIILALKISRRKDNNVIFSIDKTNINANENSVFSIPFIPSQGFDILYCDLMVVIESLKVLKRTEGKGKEEKTKFAFTIKDKIIIKTHLGNAFNYLKSLLDEGYSIEELDSKVLLEPTEETQKKLKDSFKEKTKKGENNENNEER